MAIKTERERERESPRNEIVKLYNITGLTCKKKVQLHRSIQN